MGYVLPAVAPVSTLIAMALELAPRRRIKAIAALSTVVCLAIVGAIAWQAPKSNRGAALALAQAMAPGDTVVMVDDYLYDLPFYARLRKPVVFVSDWANPELANQDNWRNELMDAAAFAPERGRQVLRPDGSQLDQMACDGGDGLDSGICGSGQTSGGVDRRHPRVQDANSELWRVQARTCS